MGVVPAGGAPRAIVVGGATCDGYPPKIDGQQQYKVIAIHPEESSFWLADFFQRRHSYCHRTTRSDGEGKADAEARKSFQAWTLACSWHLLHPLPNCLRLDEVGKTSMLS